MLHTTPRPRPSFDPFYFGSYNYVQPKRPSYSSILAMQDEINRVTAKQLASYYAFPTYTTPTYFGSAEKSANDDKIFVNDATGLSALPVGTKLQGRKHTASVTRPGRVKWNSGSYDHEAIYVTFDAPFEVVNREILAAKPILPEVGDWVSGQGISSGKTFTGRLLALHRSNTGWGVPTSVIKADDEGYSREKVVPTSTLKKAVKPEPKPQFAIGDRVSGLTTGSVSVGRKIRGKVIANTGLKLAAETCVMEDITGKTGYLLTTTLKADPILDGEYVKAIGSSSGQLLEGTLLPKGQGGEYGSERTISIAGASRYVTAKTVERAAKPKPVVITAASITVGSISAAKITAPLKAGDRVEISSKAPRKAGELGVITSDESFYFWVKLDSGSDLDVVKKYVAATSKPKPVVKPVVGDTVSSAKQLDLLGINAIVTDTHGYAFQKRDGLLGGPKWVRVRLVGTPSVVQRTSTELVQYQTVTVVQAV